MNKDEFLRAVSNLTCSGYNTSWEKESGFKDCKEKVLRLVAELDIEGMSPRTFELFRNTMNDLTSNYEQLFELQKELQQAKQEILYLQQQLIENNKSSESTKVVEDE